MSDPISGLQKHPIFEVTSAGLWPTVDIGRTKLNFGPGNELGAVLRYEPTTKCMVLGLDETTRALVLCDEGDIDTITSTYLDEVLSNPGIVFFGNSPEAGRYAFIRTFADVYGGQTLVFKSSGSTACVIFQPEDDADESDYFQWRTTDGATYLCEIVSQGVIRSHDKNPFLVLCTTSPGGPLVSQLETAAGSLANACIVLVKSDDGEKFIGLQFEYSQGHPRLKVFDNAGNDVYLDPTDGALEAA